MEMEQDTTRTTVKTYVPAYQKHEWEDHAKDLDMSLSEFVRCMVQAGRSEINLDVQESGSPHPNPGGNDLEKDIRTILENGPTDFQGLSDALRDKLEDELEETLSSLQTHGVIEQQPRGDFVLVNKEG